MGQGVNMMGQMGGEQFGQMDHRFMGFGGNTLSEVSSIFGVPVDDIIYDMGLPEDTDPNLTIAEIETKYAVSGEQVANYMVLHMGNAPTSVNSREFVQMRQQAMHGMRVQGMAQGLNFMMQGRSAFGNYTTFTFDESGEISNFALSGDLIFDSIKVSDFDYVSQNIRGSNAAYIGRSSLIYIHDNPMATMQVKAMDDKTIIFDLAENVKASIESEALNGATIIKITKNNFQGYLIVSPDYLTGDSQVSGIDIDIAGEIITVDLVENSLVMFRATTMSPQLHQTMFQYSGQALGMNQRINNGIAMGQVGAEITLQDGGNSMSFLNYTPVNVRVREARQNRVVLGVSSELKEGQIVVINMDNRTMDLTRPDRLRLRYDGALLNHTNNIDELFGNGNQPLCYFLQENDTSSMLVYVPEFSEHEIEIEFDPELSEDENEVAGDVEKADETESDDETDAEPTPAFEVLFAVVALGAAYNLKRR
jgi:MAST domain-containing protein